MRGSEWAPLYLLVVLAIAAILLVTFVKPMFRQAAVTADENTKQAKDAAKSLIFALFWPASAAMKRKHKAAADGTKKANEDSSQQQSRLLFLQDPRQQLAGGR